MLRNDRSGIIGFMITLALGVAVGAATLVVGNEVVKDLKQKKQSSAVKNSAPGPGTSELNLLYWQYDQAKRAYYSSVSQRSSDVQEKRAALIQAQQSYKLALENKSGPSQSSSTSGQRNPFDDGGTVQIGQTPQVNAAQSSSVGSQNRVGLEYYRVKGGDSLSKICQQYYGDTGMWVHILKYQIPSIAGNPNLIFPGQLIALPRNLTTGGPVVGPDPNSGTLPLPPANQGDESWETRFQKDYLISDFALTNSNSMSVKQIQSFLERKGSVLAKPYKGSTPAQMIYDAAKRHGINPQVILTRLQCEQGLISAKTASQKQLDWALGVGAYDSGNWNSKFKGFDKQVDGAAATYKRHYADAKKKLDSGQAVNMTIDGQIVRVKNAATYAFYKYNPHFHGNKLFYDVWRGFKKKF